MLVGTTSEWFEMNIRLVRVPDLMFQYLGWIFSEKFLSHFTTAAVENYFPKVLHLEFPGSVLLYIFYYVIVRTENR